MQRCMCREPIKRLLPVVTAAPTADAKTAYAVNSAVPAMSVARVLVTRPAVHQVHAVRAALAA